MIPFWVGILAALAVSAPLLASGAALFGGGAFFLRRRAQRRRRHKTDIENVDLLAQVLVVALTAGLSLHAALAMAAAEISGGPRSEVEGVMRRARRDGLAVALSSAGPLTGVLLSRLAHAQLSGASVSGAVAAFLEERRSARRAAASEAGRTLPVKLMLPLGLLILPGFILLFAGPLVLLSMSDLLGTMP